MGRTATEIPNLNKTDLIRLTGYTGSRIERLLKGVEPCEKVGRQLRYDPVVAIRAILSGEESSGERKERLQADVIEEKLQRMRGESLDRRACMTVWGDKMKRLADSIRGMDHLGPEDKQRLCEQLRHEVERLPHELEQSSFEDADTAREEK